MCILALCTRASQRWPLVLVHNRDELLSRPTLPLDVSPEGLLWSCDTSVKNGGSWMGLNVRNGNLAVLTNCRRAPTTVEGFPFQVLKEHCRVDAHGQVMFTPDASRGIVVRYFLEHGILPPASPWEAPVMDGYNVLTMNLADPQCTVRYSTNRYGLQHGAEVCGGGEGEGRTTIAMSNSYLNNIHEPKTMFLRDSVDSILSTASNDTTVDALLTALGDALSAPSHFTVSDDVIQASQPFLGLGIEERSVVHESLLGRPLLPTDPSSLFIGRWSPDKEALMHKGVYVSGFNGVYGTRSQTVVLVEETNGGRVVHYHQRETTPEGHGAWVVHRHPLA